MTGFAFYSAKTNSPNLLPAVYLFQYSDIPFLHKRQALPSDQSVFSIHMANRGKALAVDKIDAPFDHRVGHRGEGRRYVETEQGPTTIQYGRLAPSI